MRNRHAFEVFSPGRGVSFASAKGMKIGIRNGTTMKLRRWFRLTCPRFIMPSRVSRSAFLACLGAQTRE